MMEMDDDTIPNLDALTKKIKKEKAKILPSKSKKTLNIEGDTDESNKTWNRKRLPPKGDREQGKPKRPRFDENQGEITDWKKFKQERKTLKLIRQRADIGKEDFDIFKNAKRIWEDLRPKACTAGDRKKLSKQLYGLVEEKMRECILKKDMSRVIETLMETGTTEMRNNVLDIFKKEPALAWGKYSNFVAVKALKHSDVKQKKSFCTEFYPFFGKLMLHQHGREVADKMFQCLPSLKHKYSCMSGIFGKVYQACVERHPDKNKSHITALEFTKEYPEFATIFKETLATTLSKLQKGGFPFQYEFVHMALMEYFTISTDVEQENLIKEIDLHSKFDEVSRTKLGSMLMLKIFWFQSTPKERKALVKLMKSNEKVCELATDKFGHTFILGILDSMDDTVFLGKTIIAELLRNLPQLMDNQYGRKVIRFLVDPRNKTDVHPAFIAILDEGLQNPHSKKDMSIRQEEIRKLVEKELLEGVAENFEVWSSNKNGALVVATILHFCTGPKHKECLEVAAEYIKKKDGNAIMVSKLLSWIMQQQQV